uniref:Uncharacterized protein n=1 Tax=Strigamia maritima TaxID=126957 RepID=T1JC77_STRMM
MVKTVCAFTNSWGFKWDYCAPRPGITSAGHVCSSSSPCGKHGHNQDEYLLQWQHFLDFVNGLKQKDINRLHRGRQIIPETQLSIDLRHFQKGKGVTE